MKRLFLLVVLSGCMVGPNYRPPEVRAPVQWNQIPCSAEPVLSCAAPACAWWEVFQDPLLVKYIHMGAECNNSILAAEANVLQARALRQVAASKLFPQVSVDFNALRLKLSRHGLIDILGENVDRGRFVPQMINLYNAFIDMNWEIDLFGKTRRGIEAACAQIGVMEATLQDVMISVFAEIARNYIEVRGYQNQMLVIEENVELLEHYRDVVVAQRKSGYRNGLDVERIESELAQAKAQYPDVVASVYRGIYALSVLTGHLPETLVCELIDIQPLPEAPLCVDVGLRSELLLRRPDVRRAERQLAEATANIGVAVASFFPTVKLYAFAGFESVRLRNLFSSGSTSWALAENVSMPVFQGGKLVGNLKVSEAQATQAAINYQQSVLSALEEAQGAFVMYAEELATANLLNEAVEHSDKVVVITDARLKKGLVSVTDLLDVQRQLNRAQLDLLDSQTHALLDLVRLYKALGGGWECI